MRIEIPTHCPCCNYPLELINAQLFCRNPECGAQLSSKLQHFCKTLEIKGLGPKTLEKLNLSSISELFYLDPYDIEGALGSKTLANKLSLEIEKAKGADLAKVLASFSIPLIGSTASTKLAAVVSHIDDINETTCSAAGLGAKQTENLLTWLNTEFKELREFLPFSWKSTASSNASGDTVCITGKLKSFKTKADAYAALSQAGFVPVDSVTKATKFLVDEENKESTKRKKAEALGIKIIFNLSEFLKVK